MCDDCAPPSVGLTRRRLLTAAGASLAAGLVHASPAPAGMRRTPSFEIRPRDAWGADLEPTGPLEEEPDVRFLLVHHTVTANDYAADDVPGIIRGFHAFHTGADKGWPDVAYNFLVDRFGGVWEARAGSLDGAVRGSATGGNQGFDQKCAFIGDHTAQPPTPEAQSAMTELLARLADRHAIDTSPGATATFTSLGSNRHPAGTDVTTRTIEGHRSMSYTACPGDAAYPLVTDMFPDAVSAIRAERAAVTSTSTSTTTTTLAPTTAPTLVDEPAVAAGRDPTGEADSWLPPVAVGAGALAVAVGALAVAARRRRLG